MASRTEGEGARTDNPHSAERMVEVEKMFALFCAAYDREPPVGLEKKIKLASWATALEEIPVVLILHLARAELQRRESEYFPVPADIIRRWNKSQSLTPEGASNVAAYQPYVPQRTSALPAASVPLDVTPEELKRRLSIRTRIEPTDEEVEAKKEADSKAQWDIFLMVEAAAAGNIDLPMCSREQKEHLRAFGYWWQKKHPTGNLRRCDFPNDFNEFALETGLVSSGDAATTPAPHRGRFEGRETP